MGLQIVGCASGPSFAITQASFKPLKSGNGRVFLYREGLYSGSVIHPQILIDGKEVGKAVPNGFFYVDLPPGSHLVSAGKWQERISLVAGELAYVELLLKDGDFLWSVRPIQIDPDQGNTIIQKLSYTGQ